MSLEPFIYLFVLLLLTAMVLVGRWLNEQVREEINLRGLFESEETPAEGRELIAAEPPIPATSQAIAPSSRTPGPSDRQMRLQMALHNKQDLRQGIILMTVLGPCRALEPPSS